jgi:spore coat protein A
MNRCKRGPWCSAIAEVLVLGLLSVGCDGDSNGAARVQGQDGGADGPATLAPTALAKYVDPLPVPRTVAGYGPDGGPGNLTIGMWEISQQLHRDLPPTTVWAYGETRATASYPGPTIEARVGTALDIRWDNKLPRRPLLPVDTTIHWAGPASWPNGGMPTVVHVHGGLQEAPSDGHPDAWFTPDFAEKGQGWVKEVYHYANVNQPENLWYHDHALGVTRLNVYAGLAGFYLLRDPALEQQLGLPTGAYDIPLLIQDRFFQPDGSLYYPPVGDVPQTHPVWMPEVFGDFNLVNGKVWPYLEVEPRRYRFLLLNGANARFYRLSLSHGGAFTLIGTDGGFLDRPVPVNQLLLGPAERADVIVDFAGQEPGRTIELDNDAAAPFPDGDPTNDHAAKVMQFRVIPLKSPDGSRVPETLTPIPTLPAATVTRTLTLYEALDANGNSLGLFLDGKRWGHSSSDVTELPQAYSTEVWQLVNTTDDAHPIHLHLIDFRISDRQPFDVDRYKADYAQLNPTVPATNTRTLPVDSYLQQTPRPPSAYEAGWKDTVVVPPGQVTRILVRFAPDDGGLFPFDPSLEPGYVWHCHILEHEDNEMMRRYKVVVP